MPAVCESLAVVDPILTAPLPSPAHLPAIGYFPGQSDVFLSFIAAPKAAPGTLQFSRFEPFALWPPELSSPSDLSGDVVDYAVGPGAKGPVAVLRQASGNKASLAMTFLPQIESVPANLGDGEALFVAAIEGRYLMAGSEATPEYNVLEVGSYQPNSLFQSEEPLYCLTSKVLGAAIPAAGEGFIAAFNAPSSIDEPCAPPMPLPGTSLSLMRYDSLPPMGPSLNWSQGDFLVLEDPLVHVALSPASFGAWVVFQSEGANAFTPPPVFAARVDHEGHLVDPDSPYTAVSPGGQISIALAVASLGDTLAVAWVDSLDPSSSTIIVQLVRPDGALAGSAVVPTSIAWLSGRIRMLPSADSQHILVAWDGGMDEAVIGLARIDCVSGL